MLQLIRPSSYRAMDALEAIYKSWTRRHGWPLCKYSVSISAKKLLAEGANNGSVFHPDACVFHGRYLCTTTASQPLYGKLGDIFGRKPCLLFAYCVFGLGALGCGLALDMNQLITARVSRTVPSERSNIFTLLTSYRSCGIGSHWCWRWRHDNHRVYPP